MPSGINMLICAEGPGLQNFSRRRASKQTYIQKLGVSLMFSGMMFVFTKC